jgi:hypothetical protein
METDIIIKNNQVSYLNSYPFFIHANANGILYNLLLNLNYNISQLEIENIKLDENKIKSSKLLYHIGDIIKINYKAILFIILFIIFIFYKFKKL